MKPTINADYVIIGAGIIGLTIAKKLITINPKQKIIIIEKENTVGMHASGRNSGVLHSGIYYPPDSLKAKVCGHGSKLMTEYCLENKLPYKKAGKIILPTATSHYEALQFIYNRGIKNKVKVEIISSNQLQKLEPLTNPSTEKALYVPDTGVVDPLAIMKSLVKKLLIHKVEFFFNENCDIFSKKKLLILSKNKINYGHLINTTGLFADRIAAKCDIKNRYTMIPFKGLYYELLKTSNININHLIYPVPNLDIPFLGVHFTKSINDKIFIGPTAIPAFGREHYRGFKGINLFQTCHILYQLSKQYFLNKEGFRLYTHNEIKNFRKKTFLKVAQSLIPSIKSSDFILSKKVGIRAQLLSLEENKLIMDFLIESYDNDTHILNAVSPAFTSSFYFADHVVNLIHDSKKQVKNSSM